MAKPCVTVSLDNKAAAIEKTLQNARGAQKWINN